MSTRSFYLIVQLNYLRPLKHTYGCRLIRKEQKEKNKKKKQARTEKDIEG